MHTLLLLLAVYTYKDTYLCITDMTWNCHANIVHSLIIHKIWHLIWSKHAEAGFTNMDNGMVSGLQIWRIPDTQSYAKQDNIQQNISALIQLNIQSLCFALHLMSFVLWHYCIESSDSCQNNQFIHVVLHWYFATLWLDARSYKRTFIQVTCTLQPFTH
jgi:hypothetical protein